jgi:hypothetical protein
MDALSWRGTAGLSLGQFAFPSRADATVPAPKMSTPGARANSASAWRWRSRAGDGVGLSPSAQRNHHRSDAGVALLGQFESQGVRKHIATRQDPSPRNRDSERRRPKSETATLRTGGSVNATPSSEVRLLTSDFSAIGVSQSRDRPKCVGCVANRNGLRLDLSRRWKFCTHRIYGL